MERSQKQYPGIPTTADGSEAVLWVETHITQGACAYPITPSTHMGQGYELSVANGKQNLWGDLLCFLELESEHSSASSCEGFALAGGRVSNFTSGQGLVLMKEVLFTISGKRLPCVFHIAARALTSQSLNIHAGHDDVMAVADTGWGILFARNAQEACDLALIARRTAEDTHTPFMNVQDGFLTSHTIENVNFPEPDFMKAYVGNPHEKLFNFMNPAHPLQTGVVQNQDSYMKGKVAQRFFYNEIPMALKYAMAAFTSATGRKYDVIDPYELENADFAIVGMGSAMETAVATACHLRQNTRVKVGTLHITSFRPFPSRQIVDALKNVKALAVIERVDVPLMQSNPLTTEIKAAFAEAFFEKRIQNIPIIHSGVYGLGGRNIGPSDISAIFSMLQKSKNHSQFFSIGIDHPTALPGEQNLDIRPKGTFSMRGHSIGGYGSVTTNKILATVIADLFHLYVQAFPKYGSEKKGLPTNYFLSISQEPIRTHHELEHVECVVLNDVNAFNLGNPLEGLIEGGMIFIQNHESQPHIIWKNVPPQAQKLIQKNKIRVFALDTAKIAKDISSSPSLIQRMQGIVLLGIFLKITPFIQSFKLSEENLFEGIERSIQKYFSKASPKVIQDNIACVKRGYHEVVELPQSLIQRKIAA
ncbi:MAG: 2-oxoacid:acceptor oxidoreductase family protein [Deltaproteobacteria bacterium]|nr:2-oxoacid:acceptor oxidoreductase family protein [Deltaproteobacteria bacterium]